MASLDAAEKYNLVQVLDLLLEVQLPQVLLTTPLSSWAVAARFGRLRQAMDALKVLAERKKNEPLLGSRKYVPSSGSWLEGKRDYCLGDLLEETLEKVPTSAIISFGLLHAKVVGSRDKSYTWLNAADNFTLWSVGLARRNPSSASYPPSVADELVYRFSCCSRPTLPPSSSPHRYATPSSSSFPITSTNSTTHDFPPALSSVRSSPSLSPLPCSFFSFFQYL